MMQANEGLLTRTLNATRPIIMHKGGAGSGKSFAAAQAIALWALQVTGENILISAKTFPQLRKTALQFFIDVLKAMGKYNSGSYNLSASTYRLHGNTIHFMSVDDPEKIKSMNFRYAWLEEATNFTYADFKQIRLRCGRTAEGDYRIILTFNPIDRNHWLARELEGKPDVEVIHSTVNDNAFIPEAYKAQLRALAEQDINYYRVYYLGEWGHFEGLIYQEGVNFQPVDGIPDEWLKSGTLVYGLDFGYNNPTALVLTGMCGDEAFAREILFERGLTTPDLIDRLKALGVDRRATLVADCEDPGAIEQIYRAGFNVHPAVKGKDSVVNGIGTVKAQRWQVERSSVNLLEEFRTYCWAKDKEGRLMDAPTPIKWRDHSMDALRYAAVKLAELHGAGPWKPQAGGLIQNAHLFGVGRTGKPVRRGRGWGG